MEREGGEKHDWGLQNFLILTKEKWFVIKACLDCHTCDVNIINKQNFYEFWAYVFALPISLFKKKFFNALFKEEKEG